MRLSDAGLAALEALGQVKNIIRMGAFHGRLESLSFNHLLSAHGEPLLNDAKQAVTRTIEKVFSESAK